MTVVECSFCSEAAVTDASDGAGGRDLLCEGCLEVWATAVYAVLPARWRAALLRCAIVAASLPVARALFPAWAAEPVVFHD